MMFSVSLVAMVTAVGVAFDYAQMSNAADALQHQVDAGVLAAMAASMEDWDVSTEQEIRKRKEIAIEVMRNNGFDSNGAEPLVTMTSDNTILVSAETDYQLAFGGILGNETIKLSAEAESGLGVTRHVHMAILMDNTSSMRVNGKMRALKTGAKNLINAVEASGGESKVALVPFARYVRIPEEYYTASWLERPDELDTEITWQQATHTGGTCQTETRTRINDGQEEEYQTTVCTGQTTTYEEQTRTIESRFKGCVGTRPPPYSEIDGSYFHKVPGMLNLIPHQATELNYNVTAWCSKAIVPLTDDFDMLEDKVNQLHAVDHTYIPSGLLWGQAVLSPGEPFDNVDSDTSIAKIMVLMTDGQNSAQIQTGQAAEDAYKAPPYIAISENENEYSPQANLTTARMCANAKADGIVIYTIAFQVHDVETKNLLNGCASDSSMAYTPETNDELIERFGHISASLKGNARLIR